VQSLVAARLAADVMGVPTVIIARTDALDAQLLTSDIDPSDRAFIDYGMVDGPDGYSTRTVEGFWRLRSTKPDQGMDRAVARGLAYAPYADMLWFETAKPDLDEAKEFAERIHAAFPGKLLAYNCSPSFNFRKHLDRSLLEQFQDALGELGYRFNFVTLAGWHALASSSFDLAEAYNRHGMAAYAELQDKEFELAKFGYTAVAHQTEVGTAYFDEVAKVISGGLISTLAMDGSTEKAQF
jgi:isocitrate lyase